MGPVAKDSSDEISYLDRSLRLTKASSWPAKMWREHPYLFALAVLLLLWALAELYSRLFAKTKLTKVMVPVYDIENPRRPTVSMPERNKPVQLKLKRTHNMFPLQKVTKGSFELNMRAGVSPLPDVFAAKYQKFQDFKAFKNRVSTCVAKNDSSSSAIAKLRNAMQKEQKQKNAVVNGARRVRIAIGQAGPKQKHTDMMDSDHPEVSYSRIPQKSQGWGKSKHSSMTADNPEDAVPQARDLVNAAVTMNNLFLP